MFLIGIAITEANKRPVKVQKYADYAIFGLVLSFLFLFSAELKFFASKQPNYPFKLLL